LYFCKKTLYTVLILPSCRGEKDEDDFDKKRRDPVLKREIIGNPAV
jgi:hypothetical protein